MPYSLFKVIKNSPPVPFVKDGQLVQQIYETPDAALDDLLSIIENFPNYFNNYINDTPYGIYIYIVEEWKCGQKTKIEMIEQFDGIFSKNIISAGYSNLIATKKNIDIACLYKELFYTDGSNDAKKLEEGAFNSCVKLIDTNIKIPRNNTTSLSLKLDKYVNFIKNPWELFDKLIKKYSYGDHISSSISYSKGSYYFIHWNLIYTDISIKLMEHI